MANKITAEVEYEVLDPRIATKTVEIDELELLEWADLTSMDGVTERLVKEFIQSGTELDPEIEASGYTLTVRKVTIK